MSSAKTAANKPLSELEHRILKILWSQGSATAEQVQRALLPQHPLRDSTIRTVLRRLLEKGYAKHKVEGRTYIYSGTEQPQNLAVRAVRQIIDRFCQGSVEQLLAGMVENEMIDGDELQKLARSVTKKKGK